MHRFDIDVGHRTTPYGTGESIRGNVVIENSKAELAGRISILLSGRTKTKIVQSDGNSRTVYRGRHTLFANTILCKTTSTPLNALQRYSWPFSIDFPEQLPDPPFVDRQDSMNSQAQTTPPPSYRVRGNSESFVEYSLTATLFRHQSNESLYTKTISITYLPTTPTFPTFHALPGPVDRTDCQVYTAHSLLLLPENRGRRELTFGQRTMSVFQKTLLPCAAFRFSVTAPSVVFCGNRFIIMASIEHLTDRSPTPSPQVELVSLTWSLESVTRIQADDNVILKKHSDECQAEGNVVSKKRSEECRAQVWRKTWARPCPFGTTEGWTPGPFSEAEGWTKFLEATLPDTTAPEFTTFNISRSFSFNIVAKIKCLDKSFSYCSRSIDSQLQVLPRVAPTAQPSGLNASSSSLVELEEEIVDDPPTYQEAMSDPPPPR